MYLRNCTNMVCLKSAASSDVPNKIESFDEKNRPQNSGKKHFKNNTMIYKDFPTIL